VINFSSKHFRVNFLFIIFNYEVFKAFVIFYICVIWNVDSTWLALSVPFYHIKTCKVRSKESFLLNIRFPRHMFQYSNALMNKLSKILSSLLVNDGHKSFPNCSLVFRICVFFSPAHIAFNFRNLIFDPISLTVFVILNVSSGETFDIVFNHFFLEIISGKFFGFLKISGHVFKIFTEFSVFDVKFFTFKVDIFLRVFGFNTSDGDDILIAFFKRSSVQDVNFLSF